MELGLTDLLDFNGIGTSTVDAVHREIVTLQEEGSQDALMAKLSQALKSDQNDPNTSFVKSKILGRFDMITFMLGSIYNLSVLCCIVL